MATTEIGRDAIDIWDQTPAQVRLELDNFELREDDFAETTPRPYKKADENGEFSGKG